MRVILLITFPSFVCYFLIVNELGVKVGIL
jgi:hypothetical protein